MGSGRPWLENFGVGVLLRIVKRAYVEDYVGNYYMGFIKGVLFRL